MRPSGPCYVLEKERRGGIHVTEANPAHLTGHPDLAMNGHFGDGTTSTYLPCCRPGEIRACFSTTREQTMPCRNETGGTWQSGYQT